MPLLYKKLILGALRTNCYLVWEERSKECLIIDAADDGVGISEEIEILGLKPIMVLATHGHFDHVMGVLDLKLIYKIPFGCSGEDEFLLKRQKETAKYFLKREIKIPNLKKIDVDLDNKNEVDLAGENIKIIRTSGHTPGGLCFYCPKQGWLFSGDTLFDGTVGRTDFSYGSEKELEESVKRLMRLPASIMVLPGHGRATELGKARE